MTRLYSRPILLRDIIFQSLYNLLDHCILCSQELKTLKYSPLLRFAVIITNSLDCTCIFDYLLRDACKKVSCFRRLISNRCSILIIASIFFQLITCRLCSCSNSCTDLTSKRCTSICFCEISCSLLLEVLP